MGGVVSEWGKARSGHDDKGGSKGGGSTYGPVSALARSPSSPRCPAPYS